MTRLKATPDWQKLQMQARAVGVDREAKILRGYCVAEAGPFKTPGRGEFDDRSLDTIVALMKASPAGLKSRFTHPDMSSDGLGKFLGRVRNPRRDGPRVRGDLHFDPSAFSTPSGDLAGYLMDLADSDPAALSSSLVLQTDKEYRLEPGGERKKDADGNPLPPLWRPTRLHASDVVDDGDAVHGGLLSVHGLDLDGLPDALVRQASAALDNLFAGETREVIEARAQAYLQRYLDRRFGLTSPRRLSAGETMRHLRTKLKGHESIGRIEQAEEQRRLEGNYQWWLRRRGGR
jgi:hypothetical protein